MTLLLCEESANRDDKVHRNLFTIALIMGIHICILYIVGLLREATRFDIARHCYDSPACHTFKPYSLQQAQMNFKPPLT